MLNYCGNECPYQESDLDLPLRGQPFYPLNYKDGRNTKNSKIYILKLIISLIVEFVGDIGFEPTTSASRTLRASQLRQSPIFF